MDPAEQSTRVSSSGDEKLCIYGDDAMNVHILYIYNYIYTYAAYIYHMVMMAGSSASSALHPAAKSQCVGRAQRAWEGPGDCIKNNGSCHFLPTETIFWSSYMAGSFQECRWFRMIYLVKLFIFDRWRLDFQRRFVWSINRSLGAMGNPYPNGRFEPNRGCRTFGSAFEHD